MNVPEIIDSVTYQVFNVAGSYIYVCPAGVRYIIVEAVGAGGSGARTAGLLSGGSDGSGAYFKKYYAAGNYNIIVGTPGPNQPSPGFNGYAGTSSVWNTDYAGGGGAGLLVSGGAGGVLTVANVNTSLVGTRGGVGTVTNGYNLLGYQGSGGAGVPSASAASTVGGAGSILVREIY